ncbi:MAG: asparagine synthase (glutamine-hydrolyzing) [Planctomycetota bacterium]
MCGIAGFWGGFDRALLGRMSASIAHRGPDDDGIEFLAKEGVGLAHRRLSIIDLSPAGHQPMWDVTRQALIVYNGELYNYRALREELEADGCRFASRSDTEVLLNLYLRDGTEMLLRLNGIFAFALWDARKSLLFLARDGVGVKPLYYAETRTGFLFASEMKALLQCPEVDRALSFEAVHHHLAYLWCPAPRTMLRGVKKLEPGHVLLVQGGKLERKWRFYDLPYGQAIQPLAPEEAAREVRAALDRAVERQMVADVPVGAFLSGGLDSSSLVALARRHAPGRKLSCFTIDLAGGAGGWDGFAEDLPYAKRAARALGVDLHAIRVGPEMLDELSTMLYHLDEPQADPAPLHVLFISRLARQNNIKVLLSGAGGDDIFTGYRRHFVLQQERLWSWLPRFCRRGLGRAARLLPASSPWGRRAVRAFQFADLEGDQRIAGYFHWLSPGEALRLYAPPLLEAVENASFSSPLVESLGRLPPETPPLNKMLYLEGRHFLPDHNLNYTDKMSMACGVEVRVPFLDPDLLALAARLPISFKQRGRTGKWILRRAMEKDLSPEILTRPKTGFGAPIRAWLKGPLQTLLGEVLSEASLRRRGLFDPKGVKSLVERDRAGRIDAAYPIFALLLIELWCRIFVDVSLPEPPAPLRPA